MASSTQNQVSRSKEPNFEAVRLAAHVRRQELGLTLLQVVERCHLAESTVTGVFYGYSEGSVRTWWAIAKALEITVGDLLDHLNDAVGPSPSLRTSR